MSVLVISLVIWLVLIFLSVTAGIEKNWHRKLTSLYAPLRISPTEHYYSSYYYLVDSIASASNYSLKTIGEKKLAPVTDPYSKEVDAEIPLFWAKPEKPLSDPVKTAYEILERLKKKEPGLFFQDYEISGALLRLNIHKPASSGVATLSQMSYLISLTEENPNLSSLIIEPASHEKWVWPNWGDTTPVLLPKNYKENGVKFGDRGSLSYSAPTAVSMQEQQIPIRVAGFYDAGILSVGNKSILVPQSVTRTIHAVSQTFSPDGTPTNGIFLWTEDLSQIKSVKTLVSQAFNEAGISSYWKIASFEEYEFAKDLLQQFQSDRTLFLLIASIILIVACTNIISLLVLLVNDKKKEIAILQSMGASFKSIAAIFGTCGIAMGLMSCLLGSSLAIFTLKHLDTLVSFLTFLQGHVAFNPAFFGQALPNELSFEALLFVLIATPILSLAAGLIPAIKASRIRPSSVLRSE